MIGSRRVEVSGECGTCGGVEKYTEELRGKPEGKGLY
jgi:hypothetical protein